MFDALPNFWTPVMAAADLADKPVGMVLAGEKIVLFRGKDGPAALLDRCPHRGVALSLGRIAEGQLECPFHGWKFDGKGHCSHIPFNPGLERAGVGALPARELGGLIWVYTGFEATEEPVVPPALLDKRFHLDVLTEEWSAHWTRAMENMLDTPHLPWVHRGTIGSSLWKRMRPDSKMNQEVTETDWGFEDRFQIDDGEGNQINWRRPNGMELFILEKPWGRMRTHAWCVPTTTDHTRMIVATATGFGWLNVFAGLGRGFNRRVLGEDRAVLESSFPVRVPAPDDEQNVPTDKVTLRFRMWYLKNLAEREPPAATPG